MSYYGQQPAPVTAYPPPATGQAPYMAPPQGNYAPPPPPGYPGNFDVGMNPPQPAQSRGDKAFLEGCCAALCCCCLLDMCF